MHNSLYGRLVLSTYTTQTFIMFTPITVHNFGTDSNYPYVNYRPYIVNSKFTTNMAPISNITKRDIYRIMICKQMKLVIPFSTVHSVHVLHFPRLNINKSVIFSKTYHHTFQDSKRCYCVIHLGISRNVILFCHIRSLIADSSLLPV